MRNIIHFLKWTFVAIFALSTFSFTACSSDDDKFDHPIVGKWEYVDYSFTIDCDDLQATDAIASYIYDEFELTSEVSMEFKNNKRVVLEVNSGISDEIPYYIKGNILVLNAEESDPMTFKIEDSSLQILQNITNDCKEEVGFLFPEANIKKVEVLMIFIRE